MMRACTRRCFSSFRLRSKRFASRATLPLEDVPAPPQPPSDASVNDDDWHSIYKCEVSILAPDNSNIVTAKCVGWSTDLTIISKTWRAAKIRRLKHEYISDPRVYSTQLMGSDTHALVEVNRYKPWQSLERIPADLLEADQSWFTN